MSIKIKEIFCVFAVILFIISIGTPTKDSTKSAEDVLSEVMEVVDTTELVEADNTKFKKEFLVNANEFESVSYFYCESVMNVEEILLVQFTDEQMAQSLIERIQVRVEEKYNIFKDYSPQQADILKNTVVELRGNFVFCCTSSSSNEVYEQFKIAMSS